MKEPNFIKAIIPPNEDCYKCSYGEGCWFIVDDKTKEAYDLNATGGTFYGILDNDSTYYPDLKHGERLPLEMRGEFVPIVPIEALKKWKVRPEYEAMAEYFEHFEDEDGNQ